MLNDTPFNLRQDTSSKRIYIFHKNLVIRIPEVFVVRSARYSCCKGSISITAVSNKAVSSKTIRRCQIDRFITGFPLNHHIKNLAAGSPVRVPLEFHSGNLREFPRQVSKLGSADSVLQTVLQLLSGHIQNE
ncbi:hypothetical protein D3C73_1004530 [compost metagenome]